MRLIFYYLKFFKYKQDIDKLTSKRLNDEEYEKLSQLINKIPSDDEIKPLIEKSKNFKRMKKH